MAAYKFRGFAQIGRSDFDKAIADFTKQSKRLPTIRSSMSGAASPNEARKGDEALADYTTAIEKNRNDPEVYNKRDHLRVDEPIR